MRSGRLVGLECFSERARVPTLLALILHTVINCSFSDSRGEEKVQRTLRAVILHRQPILRQLFSGHALGLQGKQGTMNLRVIPRDVGVTPPDKGWDCCFRAAL